MYYLVFQYGFMILIMFHALVHVCKLYELHLLNDASQIGILAWSLLLGTGPGPGPPLLILPSHSAGVHLGGGQHRGHRSQQLLFYRQLGAVIPGVRVVPGRSTILKRKFYTFYAVALHAVLTRPAQSAAILWGSPISKGSPLPPATS